MAYDEIDKKDYPEYIDHIQNITYNPFFTSKIIHAFLTGYGEAEIPYNIIYIVLPIVYYLPSRKLLIVAKNTSTLRSLFVDDIAKSIALGGLQNRILYFSDITNHSIIVAANEGKIQLNENGCIVLSKKLDYKKVMNRNVREFLRAAYYLGVICSKMNISYVYRLLGVTLS
ncbi:DUF6521 family protein [Paenibacillus sp. PK4536]|uniref:three component ABC system middle component n=1 Tax=Paenibacillus sp. PK4536 TaxID=3024576 RepID=UPI00235946E8|nr:three component ABC system middle component [Paenibacillus sp. PK4536]WIM38689.1 DUF6521 family protein [Paenibacillus sp. PK4536]